MARKKLIRKKHHGGLWEQWTSYLGSKLNPYNYGYPTVTGKNFGDAFRTAQKDHPDASNFIWKGTRYLNELKGESKQHQPTQDILNRIANSETLPQSVKDNFLSLYTDVLNSPRMNFYDKDSDQVDSWSYSRPQVNLKNIERSDDALVLDLINEFPHVLQHNRDGRLNYLSNYGKEWLGSIMKGGDRDDLYHQHGTYEFDAHAGDIRPWMENFVYDRLRSEVGSRSNLKVDDITYGITGAEETTPTTSTTSTWPTWLGGESVEKRGGGKYMYKKGGPKRRRLTRKKYNGGGIMSGMEQPSGYTGNNNTSNNTGNDGKVFNLKDAFWNARDWIQDKIGYIDVSNTPVLSTIYDIAEGTVDDVLGTADWVGNETVEGLKNISTGDHMLTNWAIGDGEMSFSDTKGSQYWDTATELGPLFMEATRDLPPEEQLQFFSDLYSMAGLPGNKWADLYSGGLDSGKSTYYGFKGDHDKATRYAGYAGLTAAGRNKEKFAKWLAGMDPKVAKNIMRVLKIGVKGDKHFHNTMDEIDYEVDYSVSPTPSSTIDSGGGGGGYDFSSYTSVKDAKSNNPYEYGSTAHQDYINAAKSHFIYNRKMGGKRKKLYHKGGKPHTHILDKAKEDVKLNNSGTIVNDMYDPVTGKIGPMWIPNKIKESTEEKSNIKKQTGGRRKRLYRKGGVPLEGGIATKLPGGATEFTGRTHEQGGIYVDDQTEVENGETMDKVYGQDYFFSNYLKLGGRTFSDLHKNLLYSGANQAQINALADIQEKVSGRAKMRFGGKRKLYKKGGPKGLNEDHDYIMNKISGMTNKEEIFEFIKSNSRYEGVTGTYYMFDQFRWHGGSEDQSWINEPTGLEVNVSEYGSGDESETGSWRGSGVLIKKGQIKGQAAIFTDQGSLIYIDKDDERMQDYLKIYLHATGEKVVKIKGWNIDGEEAKEIVGTNNFLNKSIKIDNWSPNTRGEEYMDFYGVQNNGVDGFELIDEDHPFYKKTRKLGKDAPGHKYIPYYNTTNDKYDENYVANPNYYSGSIPSEFATYYKPQETTLYDDVNVGDWDKHGVYFTDGDGGTVYYAPPGTDAQNLYDQDIISFSNPQEYNAHRANLGLPENWDGVVDINQMVLPTRTPTDDNPLTDTEIELASEKKSNFINNVLPEIEANEQAMSFSEEDASILADLGYFNTEDQGIPEIFKDSNKMSVTDLKNIIQDYKDGKLNVDEPFVSRDKDKVPFTSSYDPKKDPNNVNYVEPKKGDKKSKGPTIYDSLFNDVTMEEFLPYLEEAKILTGIEDFNPLNSEHVEKLQTVLMGGAGDEFDPTYFSGRETDILEGDLGKNKKGVDGKYGIDTHTALMEASEALNEEEEIEVELTDVPEVELTDPGTTTTEEVEYKDPFPWNDVLTGAIMAGQLLPAWMAYRDKPDYMHQPGRIPTAHLDRISMDDALGENAANYRGMGKFIENSGIGPGSITAKMAAWDRKVSNDAKIQGEENRMNAQIGNQEAILNQKARATNIQNQMVVDEFNRAADAATKDRKIEAVQNAMHTLAGINTDLMQYRASENLAQAYSGASGVMDRHDFKRVFDKVSGIDPQDPAYAEAFNQAYAAHVAGAETTTTGGQTTKRNNNKRLFKKDKSTQPKLSKKHPNTMEYKDYFGNTSYMSPIENISQDPYQYSGPANDPLQQELEFYHSPEFDQMLPYLQQTLPFKRGGKRLKRKKQIYG